MKVRGARWTPWSGSHFYRNEAEATKAMEHLNHKQHPVPSHFRVQPYVPLLQLSEDYQ